MLQLNERLRPGHARTIVESLDRTATEVVWCELRQRGTLWPLGPDRVFRVPLCYIAEIGRGVNR